MSENRQSPVRHLEQIVRQLPILPALGFVYAISYEAGFFFSFDIEMRQVLSLSDIVESSALKVVPTIPLLLFGYWMGSAPPIEEGKTAGQKTKRFIADLPYNSLKILIILVTILYVLFGILPSIGLVGITVFAMLIFGRLVLLPILADTSRETFIVVWIAFFSAAIFAQMGLRDAQNIRWNDRSKLPLLIENIEFLTFNHDEFRLVRRFSSGSLVTKERADNIWFIQNDSRIVVEFKMNTEPYRGILCGGFNWCPEMFSDNQRM